MKKWMMFCLAFLCVAAMLYAGIDALSSDKTRMGLFLTFVGSMTVIGLAVDFFNYLKNPRRSM